MKYIITTIAGIIVCGFVIAATYSDVTPEEFDDKGNPIIVQDESKTIKKEWTEQRSSEFSIEDKLSQMEQLIPHIQAEIGEYNKIADELQEAKSSLGLDVVIPNKIKISEVK